jgi:hypothetical protein
MEHRAYLKRFYGIAICGICVLLVMVWLLIQRDLSRQGFAVVVSIWWIAMFAAFFILIRSRQRSAEALRRQQIANGVSVDIVDRDRCQKNIRSTKWLIVAFGVLLAYGLLTTHGKPLLPRLVGAAVDLAIIAVCAHTLSRSKKRLQQNRGEQRTRNFGMKLRRRLPTLRFSDP